MKATAAKALADAKKKSLTSSSEDKTKGSSKGTGKNGKKKCVVNDFIKPGKPLSKGSADEAALIARREAEALLKHNAEVLAAGTRDILTAVNEVLEAEAEGDEEAPLVYLGEATERICLMARNAEQHRLEAQKEDGVAQLAGKRERLEQCERQVFTTAAAKEESERQLPFLNHRFDKSRRARQASDETMAQ